MRTLLSVNGGNFKKIVIIIDISDYCGRTVLYDAKTKKGYYPVKSGSLMQYNYEGAVLHFSTGDL